MPFVLFFLAEYGALVLMSTLTTVLFLGGYILPLVSLDTLGVLPALTLALKSCISIFAFV